MFLCVIVCLLLIILLWYLHFLKTYYFLKSVPGPKNVPIIGCALHFRNLNQIFQNLDNMFEKHKTKTLRLTVGIETALLTQDYKFLEFIFSSPQMITKGESYKFMRPMLGDGLITSSGEKWQTNRKILTPSFHFKILEDFNEIFNRNINILVEKLSHEVTSKSFDIRNYISLCTLDIVCESAMGAKVNAQMDGIDSLYMKCIKTITKYSFNRHFNPIYHYDCLYKFSSSYRTEKAALDVVHKHTESVIRQRREEFENHKGNFDQDELGQKKRFAFLDMLLATKINGQSFKDEELRDEVSTFMFAGHDTTATVLHFTIYVLANHPEIQNKVYEEVCANIEDINEISYRNLQDLKYTELVFKESMRMFPTVPMLSRLTTEYVNFNGLIIPPNISIGLYVYGIHRNPEFFPEPDKFIPERFLPENYDSSKPYAYVPFSAGQRNCLGQKFAMLELKCTISKILKRFQLLPAEPKHDLQLVPESLITSTNGIRIRIKERSQ